MLFASRPVVFVAVIEGVAVGGPVGVTGVVGDPPVERELETAVDDPDGDGITEIEVCTDEGVDPGVLLMTEDVDKPNVSVDNPVEDKLTGFEVAMFCPEDVVDPGVLLMTRDVDKPNVFVDNPVEDKLTGFEVAMFCPEDVVDPGILLMTGDVDAASGVKA